jgi:hypothetical protein
MLDARNQPPPLDDDAVSAGRSFRIVKPRPVTSHCRPACQHSVSSAGVTRRPISVVFHDPNAAPLPNPVVDSTVVGPEHFPAARQRPRIAMSAECRIHQETPSSCLQLRRPRIAVAGGTPRCVDASPACRISRGHSLLERDNAKNRTFPFDGSSADTMLPVPRDRVRFCGCSCGSYGASRSSKNSSRN